MAKHVDWKRSSAWANYLRSTYKNSLTVCWLITHSAVSHRHRRHWMNRGPNRPAITTSAWKIDRLLSVGQPVRAKLDEKRRLRNGDLRWLSHVRLYQSLDVKLEDGMTRRKSHYIRVSNELPILILFTRTIRSSHRPHRRLYSRRQTLRRRMATAINRLLWNVVVVRRSIQRVTDDADSYNFNRVLKRKKRLISMIFLQNVGRASSIHGPLGPKVVLAWDRPAH
jgi:hypothetical protein